ncbi:uncharacterized protein LOC144642517 [Oculina patagonica]
MKTLVTVSIITVAICCLLLKDSSASLIDLDPEEEWEDPLPWPRAHNLRPNVRRRVRRWPWRKRFHRPKTTLRPTPVPATTARPGPEICQNRAKVTRIQDELGPIVCLRKNVTELMKQLKEVGGFIKRYMGVEVIDACGFEDLTVIDNLAHADMPPPTTTKSISATTPTTKIQSSRKIGKREADEQQSDAELQRHKRNVPTSPGTIFRGCQGRGTIPDGASTHRLCTECAATTRLENDRFPPYINEVVCRDADRQCAANMGLCFQRNLLLSFLRSTGNFEFDPSLSSLTGKTVYKEVWIEYTQEIRSCCECQMYTPIYSKIASSDD